MYLYARVEPEDKYSYNHDPVWDTGLKVYEHCPHVKQPVFLVDYEVFELVRRLAEKYRSTEFLVYAQYVKKGNAYYIHTPYIPEQEVTGASVDVDESVSTEYRVVIHKHPSGVDSFSSTDDEYINANNDVSLLWLDGKFVDAVVRVRVPCGVYISVRAKPPTVYVAVDKDRFEELEKRVSSLVKEASRKIKQKTLVYTPSYRYYGSSGSEDEAGNSTNNGYDGDAGTEEITPEDLEEYYRWYYRDLYS